MKHGTMTIWTTTLTLATVLCAAVVAPAGGHAARVRNAGGPQPPGPGAVAAAESHGQQVMESLAATDVCSQTALLAGLGSYLGLQEDLDLAQANCLNLTDPQEAAQCQQDAATAFQDGIDEIVAQFQARKQICALLGGGAYDPEIEKHHFNHPKANPLFPFTPGTSWTYNEATAEGLEVNVVTVTDQTKVIDGITCTVVHDTVALDGVLTEDTLDYYAADNDGNVWYFGELSQEFVDGVLDNIEGSFTAGVNGAKPGTIMLAAPVVGLTYREEFLINEAEDVATVLSLDEHASVPFGNFDHCLETADFSALDVGVIEDKFFAPGVGMVMENDLFTGTQVVLVDFTPGH